MRAWLDSVSCLSFGRTFEEFKSKTTDSALSTTEGSNLPLFLQDQGTLNATKDLLEKVQVSKILDILNFKSLYLHICTSAAMNCASLSHHLNIFFIF